MSKDTRQTRQKLDVERELPKPEPIPRDLWHAVLAAARKAPIPELRGLRITWGMRDALASVASFAGVDGDRCTATNRRVSAHSGRCERVVQHARQMARAAGLLKRESHGAGRYAPGTRRKNGALDILAFPGGVEGAKKFLARLRDGENLAMAAGRSPKRAMPSQLTEQAQRVLDQNKGLAAQIARELDQPRNETGALRVVAEVLSRAPRKRLRNPGAYVMTAVRRDHRLRTLWPRHAAASAGADLVRDAIAGLGKMPD